MARHNRVGKWGEELAVQYLVGKGYAIVKTNWRLKHFEIDIIAMHNNRLVFVEVKTRTNPDDDPLLAIDRRKMMQMTRAANAFVLNCDSSFEVQFDIIAITGNEYKYTLEHIPDAFLPPLRTYR